MLWQRKLDNNWINRERLRVALVNSWAADTAYPKDAPRWSRDIPSRGQCAVTALVVQDYLGGDIVFNKAYNHFWISTDFNSSIDITRDQFEPEAQIEKDKKVKRLELLNGDKARAAKTPERYKLLRTRVDKEIQKLSPMLLLFSSNATEEYILDILECFALPQNYAHHFRYQHLWLPKELKEILPFENEPLPKVLKNSTILIVYLNQSRVQHGKYQWVKAIPIRTARLISAFRTGPANDDKAIAHFYFKLIDHVEQSEIFDYELKKSMSLKYGKSYAAFIWGKEETLFKKFRLKAPFERLSEKLNDAGFDYDGEKVKDNYLSPLYVKIDGLFTKRGKIISPQYDKVARKSFYKLNEAKQYLFKFRTYAEKDELHRSFKVSLKSFKENFASPEIYSQDVKSQYNSECWELIPRFSNQNSRTYTVFKTNCINHKNKGKSLDLKLIVPVTIKRSWFLRISEILSDVGFGIGTGYLALSKLYELNKSRILPEWYYVVIPSYLIWIIAKLFVKFRRG